MDGSQAGQAANSSDFVSRWLTRIGLEASRQLTVRRFASFTSRRDVEGDWYAKLTMTIAGCWRIHKMKA